MKYLYQLPQNILGLIGILFFRGKHIETYNDKKVYLVKGDFAVSLGNYILISRRWWGMMSENGRYRMIAHEYGHCRQSEYLGWLYLLIVGIPSLTFNLISRKSMKWSLNYYNRYPENWADKLGNVDRKSF